MVTTPSFAHFFQKNYWLFTNASFINSAIVFLQCNYNPLFSPHKIFSVTHARNSIKKLINTKYNNL